jgi:hypothetical protein
VDELLEFFRKMDPIPWREIIWNYGRTFLLGAVVAWLALWVARIRLARRDFLHRINFSLNDIEDNELKIRTLKESDIEQIILNNRHARNLLVGAARAARSSEKSPFLDLPESCSWLVLNAILNEISEMFPGGPVAKSMGIPVRSVWYVFGVTCEWDDDVKMRKIRVMLMAEELLKRLDQYPDLKYQHPWHRVRHETLRRMRKLYDEDRRVEAAEQDRQLQRDKELAAMPEEKRQRAIAADRKAAGRTLPVRNLMRIELALPFSAVMSPDARFAREGDGG